MSDSSYKLIHWRQVWLAMHDLWYKRDTYSSVVARATAAGLQPSMAVKLANWTCTNGYMLTRSLPE